MRKLLLVSMLFMSINLIGQTKLDLINSKLVKVAEVDMKELNSKWDHESQMATGETCYTIPSNLEVFIEDIKFTGSDNNGEMIVKGYYSCENKRFFNSTSIQLQFTRNFYAKVKPLLDDFVVTDFASEVQLKE